VGRAAFAGRTSLSKDTISQICNQDAGCVSRETAQLIFRETARAVSPNVSKAEEI
jgi:3,4-dihydroxy 2-butanone 4-phosphate synthase/GTP cyclohydrolase II